MAAKAKKVEIDRAGYDGAVIFETSVRLSGTRTEKRMVRARPGSFEWRYNRDDSNLTPLYHAGVKFATLWEKAGIASDSSPDLSSSGGGSQWAGCPDVRVAAMSEINEARKEIGRLPTARLVDYCVMGTTAGEMAGKYGVEERSMSSVLMLDLRACAMHFKLL